VCCAALEASILPLFHLDPATSKAFDDYIDRFEKTAIPDFTNNGKLWIDHTHSVDSLTPVLEARENEDVAHGSIHHFSGFLHVNSGQIDAVRRVMEDYPNYVKYFKGDLGASSGSRMDDSSPADEHFHSKLLLVQSTLWLAVSYDTLYDSHYRRLDDNRWMSVSRSLNIKELRDPKNPEAGTFTEGEDHGFLWRTHTYWFVRQRNGGLDLEADSITLSRPIPTGFGWWGKKRTHDAVEKMLTDLKAAIEKR
jgi:hypothetical protein